MIIDQVSHEADRSLCHTQLCWEREGILGESAAAEPCVAWRRESEKSHALRYCAQERSEEAGGRGVRGRRGDRSHDREYMVCALSYFVRE